LNKAGARCAAIFAALLPFAQPVVAQDVTLTSRDGTLSVSGTFQGYDGELFRIMTEYGPLTVDGEGVVCDGPACPDLTRFVARVRVVAEAEAGARLLPPLLAAFARERGLSLAVADREWVLSEPSGGRVVARFAFEPRASEAAAEALRLGVAELALSAVGEEGLSARVLGQEALVAVVSPDNPIPGLTTPDLARALSGEVTNWQEVGGPDMPLIVHALPERAGFRRALEVRLGKEILASEVHESPEALAAAVVRDPWALAVTPAARAGNARVLPLTDSCGVLLRPSVMGVAAGDYALALPFFMLAPKRRLPLMAREFLDFAQSPSAREALEKAGLTGRAVVRADLIGDGRRLANAIGAIGPDVPATEVQRLAAAMQGAERLSLTFRYDPDGRTLDAASRDNLEELVRLIDAGLFMDRDLVFAGFSDGEGSGEANLALSRRRAEALLDEVATALPDLGDMRVSLRAEAFGEAMPLACDETPVGRQTNRRVELWMRPTLR
jgi:phosphate transport system substrate-binding protein